MQSVQQCAWLRSADYSRRIAIAGHEDHWTNTTKLSVTNHYSPGRSSHLGALLRLLFRSRDASRSSTALHLRISGKFHSRRTT
eukprot:6172672-Pleurochrysis_carterae.AAC.3